MANKHEYAIGDMVVVVKGQFKGTEGRIVNKRIVGDNPDNYDYSVSYTSGGGHWHYGSQLKGDDE